MRRVPVESSVIRDVGYDAAKSVLEVGFHNGTVYRYHLVPARVHRELMAAESPGRYLNQEIKPRFPGQAVE
ncbi:KTSC domain-containing protein [Amycolatopsis echigonensis]|uniref:KTSC domain-containing protein n=1 Tax=Amycolatopsis echigonensis TaxID=2576905 RepID=A0A8E1T3Q6_9PSEU|nr:KTSC domain-containing protein [Amycolatopsis echigonensis]MBB2497817.1 KTSC domain-containing protein [Amycolatopsis echigonensis]